MKESQKKLLKDYTEEFLETSVEEPLWEHFKEALKEVFGAIPGGILRDIFGAIPITVLGEINFQK